MRRYAAVLLDVDGTLVDSNDAHAHAWVDVFAERDVEVSVSRVRAMIGMGGDRMIEQVLGIPRGTRQNAAIGERRAKVFLDRWLARVRPLVGSRELVLRLRAEGYQYAIASAARSDELGALLEVAGVADLSERRTSSSDAKESKPDPEAIEAALAVVSAERSRAVMIGDTPYDVQAARGASVDMIGFTSGGWPEAALAGSVAAFAGPAGLLAMWEQSPLAARG